MPSRSTLLHWRPHREFAELHRRVDHLFDDLAGGEGAKLAAVDVFREGDRMVVRADMPGIKPDDVKIELAGDTLTIHGERREQRDAVEKRYVRRERTYHSFSRSLVLPADVDPAGIEATCENGVVEVSVPLPAQEPRVIKITPTAAS
jgi:HSP20 family protein